MFHLTGYETNADRLREGHWLKNEAETKFDKQQFSREEMVRWINANRMSSVYKFGVENGGRVGRWPWGDHHTELLGHLEAAGIRFWGASYYDPTDKGTAPKNEDIESWLEKERGLESNSMRKKIATILRLNGLPKGPRTK
jgi:hypothetical protein